MSPKPFTPEHRTPRDVEGSEALCSHTGASAIFGLSSGEVIALTCTLRLDAIRKAVIYEPPFCLSSESTVRGWRDFVGKLKNMSGWTR